MNYQKKSIKLSSGETYAYIEQGKGDKNVVLVHGNMSSSVHFHPLLSRIPKEYRVLAPDLRGFGDSTYHSKIKTLKDFADDVSDFCNKTGVTSADFVGWSTGGGIIMELVLARPELVKSLILIESVSVKGYPIFKKDEKGVPKIGEIYQSSEEMASDPMQVAPALAAFKDKNFAFTSYLWDAAIYSVKKPTKEDNEIYVNETMKQRNLAEVDYALACFNLSDQPNPYTERSGQAEKIRCPILITSGDLDYVVPLAMVQENVSAFKHAVLHRYSPCGHSPLMDMPDTLASDILSFIE